MIGPTPYIMFGNAIWGTSGDYSLNASGIRMAFGFDPPEDCTLVRIVTYAGVVSGNVTGDTYFQWEVCAADSSGYPGTVLQTVYSRGVESVGWWGVEGFNVNLQKYQRYYIVVRNNHPDPAANHIRIRRYIPNSGTFVWRAGGSGRHGFSGLISTDGGSTWPTTFDGTGIILVFADGTYWGYVGENPVGAIPIRGRWYRTGVFLGNPSVGDLHLRGVTFYHNRNNTPPPTRAYIEGVKYPYPVYASSQNTHLGGSSRDCFLFPSGTTLSASTKYRVYLKADNDGGDSSNYAAIYASELGLIPTYYQPYGELFHACWVQSPDTDMRGPWRRSDLRYTNCAFVLDAQVPFFAQTAPSADTSLPDDRVNVVPPYPNYLGMYVYYVNQQYDVVGGNMRMFGIHSMVDGTPDLFELLIVSVTGSPSLTVELTTVDPSNGAPSATLATATFNPTGAGWYQIPLTGYSFVRNQTYWLIVRNTVASTTARVGFGHYGDHYGGGAYSWDGTTLTLTNGEWYHVAFMWRDQATQQWYGRCQTTQRQPTTTGGFAYSYRFPNDIWLWGASFGSYNPSALVVGLWETEDFVPQTLITSRTIGTHVYNSSVHFWFDQPYRVREFAITYWHPTGATVTGKVLATASGSAGNAPSRQRMGLLHPNIRVLWRPSGVWTPYLYNNDYTVPYYCALWISPYPPDVGGSKPVPVTPIRL